MQASEESNPATYTSAVRLFRVSHRLFLSQLLHLADLEKSPVYRSFLGCCDKMLYWVAWWVSTHFLPVLESGRTWPSIGMGWLSWGLSLWLADLSCPHKVFPQDSVPPPLLRRPLNVLDWVYWPNCIHIIWITSVKTPDPIKGHMLGSWTSDFSMWIWRGTTQSTPLFLHQLEIRFKSV